MSINYTETKIEEVYLPSTSKNFFGQALYDETTNVLRIEISKYTKRYAIDQIKFLTELQNGRTLFPVENIMSEYEFDLENSPSCVSFVPSQQMIESGAEQIPNWEFNRGNVNPMCTHSTVTAGEKYAPCRVYPNTILCGFSVLSDWEFLQSLRENDHDVVVMEKMFTSCRVPKYRVKHDEEIVEFSDIEFARDYFHQVGSESGKDLTEFAVMKKGSSYFEKILQV